MTYISQEESTESGQPLELYLFKAKLGTEQYAYCSGNVEVTHLGITYYPSPVKRGSLSVSSKASSGSLKVTVPRTNQFVLRYLSSSPPLPDELTIYRGHSSDPSLEIITFWQGDVDGVQFEEDTATITLTTLYQRLQRAIPKRTYSWACNHVLYDAGCRVGAEGNRSDALVSSISDDGLIVNLNPDPAWLGTTLGNRLTNDIKFFNGGYCKFTNTDGTIEYRTIANVSNDAGAEATLSIPINGLAVGGTLHMYAGCDHSVQTCHSKFSNVPNYGGCPFVPSANPFSTGVITEYSTPKS